MDISSTDHDWHYQRRRRVIQYATLFISIVITTASSLLQQLSEASTREPYHTSILTGEGWVLELLAGHPMRIRTELGVSHHCFSALITALRSMGFASTRNVSLEEQLLIFLYASVTGLSVRHLGERFQRSNATISR